MAAALAGGTVGRAIGVRPAMAAVVAVLATVWLYPLLRDRHHTESTLEPAFVSESGAEQTVA